jgi:hypothetical protein
MNTHLGGVSSSKIQNGLEQGLAVAFWGPLNQIWLGAPHLAAKHFSGPPLDGGEKMLLLKFYISCNSTHFAMGSRGNMAVLKTLFICALYVFTL